MVKACQFTATRVLKTPLGKRIARMSPMTPLYQWRSFMFFPAARGDFPCGR